MKIKYLLQFPDANDCWLVGVSGGRDSIVLLELLIESGLNNLVVVHVNHQLRNEESDGDAKFVESLALKRGLRFYSEAIDVLAVSETEKKGLELAARETRQRVYSRALMRYSAGGIFLGHHADDQAETILFNLLRGSNGLKGIRDDTTVVVDECELRIIRPLLGFRRAEIDEYIKIHGIEYREDGSNAEAFTARNRLRHEALPLLAEIMQREVVPSMNSAAEVSMDQASYLSDAVDLEEYLDPQGRIFLPRLLQLDTILQSELMFKYLQCHRVSNISRGLIKDCLALGESSHAAKCNLPEGKWLRRKQQRLFIQES